MDILLIEPFFTGSHKKWAEGFQSNSDHNVRLLTLSGANWKWRMHGAAITLSEQFKSLSFKPDLILATDMLDLTTFVANCRKKLHGIPLAIYFHENQITYPWSPNDQDVKLKRDNHYGFINYTSALVADKVFFNSEYHLKSFLEALPKFLGQFPDHNNLDTVERIRLKSTVLHLGLDLKVLDEFKPQNIEYERRATILWNHRWEYDKNPEAFFDVLRKIKSRGWDFNLVVLGEQFSKSPAIFESAEREFAENTLHWGYVDSKEEYAKWLWKSDILPVTSNQDYFGGSVVEAMYSNVKPLLPNRLAYPEHIPEKLRSIFLYKENELVDKLQRWIKDVSVLRKQQTRSYVEHYDWSSLIAKYDCVLL